MIEVLVVLALTGLLAPLARRRLQWERRQPWVRFAAAVRNVQVEFGQKMIPAVQTVGITMAVAAESFQKQMAMVGFSISKFEAYTGRHRT